MPTHVAAAVLALATAAVVVAASPAGAQAPVNGRIAFQADVGKHSQIFTIEPDGSGLTQVTRFPFRGDAGAEQPHWSPDGSRIAFDTDASKTLIAPGACAPPRRRPCVNIFTIGVDGSSPAQLPLGVGAFNGAPAYSADGTQISFDQDVGPSRPAVHGIYVAGADGANARRVTRGIATKDAFDTRSQWSPDGTHLVFTRVKNATEAAIFTVRLDGTGLRRLTSYRLDAAFPDWSPDGRTIAFESYFDPHKGKSANIFTIRPDGSHMAQLTHLSGGQVHAFGPAWSPDGTQLVFHKVGPTVNDLFLLDAIGGNQRRLTHLRKMNPNRADWGTAP
jgi:Tol biopolymer transport system component